MNERYRDKRGALRLRRKPRGRCPECGREGAINARGEIQPHEGGPRGHYHTGLKALPSLTEVKKHD